MFNDNESYVTLGVSSTRKISRKDPFSSRIGGEACFIEKNHEIDLKCKKCGDNLTFICQFYTPIENFDRMIYCFACNKRNCSLSSQGWIIFRQQRKSSNQNEVMSSTSNDQGEGMYSVSAHEVVTEKSKPKNKSKSNKKKGQDKVDQHQQLQELPQNNLMTGSSDWTSIQFEDLGDLDDLESLLSVRDASLPPQPTTTIVTTIPSPDTMGPNTKESSVLFEYPSSTMIGIDVIDEPDGVGVQDQLIDNTIASDDRIRELLKAYTAEEDDTDIVRMLSSVSLESKAINNSNDCDEEKEEEEAEGEVEVEEDTLMAALRSGRDHGLSIKDRSENEGLSGAKGNAKKYKREQIHRMESLFQRLVSRQPNQVLRYAYGGEPLWCTLPPPPFPSSVSKNIHNYDSLVCPCCGARRVFEFQLMPALLSTLEATKSKCKNDSDIEMKQGRTPVSIHNAAVVGDTNTIGSVSSSSLSSIVTPSTTGAVSATRQQVQSFLQDLNEGVDFGVVAVWSCEASCDAGSEEFVLIQPPSDIGVGS